LTTKKTTTALITNSDSQLAALNPVSGTASLGEGASSRSIAELIYPYNGLIIEPRKELRGNVTGKGTLQNTNAFLAADN
jgi:hypothetical protein